MKNFSKTYRALGDFEVRKLYVERESLDERGLSEADLMPIVYEDENEDNARKSLPFISSTARKWLASSARVTWS